MTKKIRLIDEAEDTATTAPAAAALQQVDADRLMGYLEAIDWKLWEMLTIMKNSQSKDR